MCHSNLKIFAHILRVIGGYPAVAELFDSLPAGTVLCIFLQYSITFCSQCKAVGGVISGKIVSHIVHENVVQGHHHNGDQAAQRPHTMCSICGRRFATPRFGVRGESGMGLFDSPPMGSYQLHIGTYGLSRTIFQLFSRLQNRFHQPVFLSNPDTMTNTALEATTSSSGNQTLA